MENTETEVWLEFAGICQYITIEQKNLLKGQTQEIGKLINFMLHYPDKFQ